MLCYVFFWQPLVKDDSKVYVMLYECHYPSDHW